MKSAWKNPIYIGQLLAGLAAIGAIFADGQLTRLRLYLAVIVGLSMLASLLVAARAEADSQRTRQQLETLLRSMELPYFIIERLSTIIQATADNYGWHWDKQENFERETVYSFHEVNGAAPGRLVMSKDEFKRLWILEEDERVHYLVRRLFGKSHGDVKEPSTQNDKLLDEVVRQAVFEETDGPLWIGLHPKPNGTLVYAFRPTKDEAEYTFLTLVPSRRKELEEMNPLRRYAAIADDAKRGFRAAADCTSAQ